jgi:anti-sigma B factor antagonist
MELTVDVRIEDDRAIISPAGEIDAYTAPKLREELTRVTESGCSRVFVNLEFVDFIDSTGLGVLIGGLKRMRNRNGDLELVSSNTSILRLLDLTGLSKSFRIHDRLENALPEDQKN